MGFGLALSEDSLVKMPKVGVSSKEAVQLAAFFLRGAAGSSISLHHRKIHLGAFRGEILVAGLCLGSPHPLLDQSLHHKNAVESLKAVAHLVTNLDRTGWFNGLAVNTDVAGLALGGCQRSRLTLSDAPQPHIHPDRIHGSSLLLLVEGHDALRRI